jgi:uncharacterized protein (DUF433 family)
MTILSKEHISKTQGICGGRACIAGHRIRVMDVVALYNMRGMSPSEILYQYPGITLADVYAALTYYHDNRAEIDSDFEIEKKCDEFGRTQPSRLSDNLKGGVTGG